MKTYEPSNIRNVLLLGHGGAGKTTLLEAMLFASGGITRMGRVEDGNTVSDHDPEEVRKGISVSLSLAPVEIGGVKINVLDAPGYADFVGDVHSAVRAVDAVIIVVSAVDGVEVQTEVGWELAAELGLPRAIVINKLDRERASFERTLDELVKSFGTQVAPLQFPIGEEHEFHGVANLLSGKAFTYGSDPNGTEGEWPDELHAKADPLREKLTEAIAEADDALLEQYLETGELPTDELVKGLHAGFVDAKVAPVLVTSADKPVGVDLLTKFVADVFPSPLERAPVKVEGPKGEAERSTDANGTLTALVFKTVSDQFVGHISMFRVFSGRVRPDSAVYNATKKTEERIGQLFTLKGKDHDTVSEVPAGDIGAVAKLSHTHTGDTFSPKDDPVVLPPIPMPEPLLGIAVEPKTKGDEDKLSTALARAREEDPTLRIERSEETHETVMYGMGEAHLDVVLERMKRRSGVDVTHRPARIPYKETLRGTAKAQGRHVKQSGGHGQYAVCWIEVAPLPHGGGFEFDDKIVGGVIPNQFIPSVEKGVIKAMTDGVAAGYPMVDVKVTLYDGKFHTVDSSDIAFQIAGGLAMREAANLAGVSLLEPIVELEVVVPESYTGDIMGDLNSKRGKIQGMEQTGSGRQRVKALVPLAEVARYSIDLRSMTGGRGTFGMKFSHYEEVPQHIAQKIIDEGKKDK
ncbi:MAG TPA: elongation factor G [Actinomycetota bacterium]|jgi:elongation factor G